MTKNDFHHKINITNRCFRKMVKDMKKLLAIFCTAFFVYTALNTLFAAEPVYSYQQVKVTSGDTLWGIASRAAGEGQDVREVVCHICDANGLTNKNIYPGQVLKVPVAVRAADDLMLASR